MWPCESCAQTYQAPCAAVGTGITAPKRPPDATEVTASAVLVGPADVPHVSVTVRRDEPLERALKRFKRMCERVGIRKLVRERERYEKPSDQKRRELRKQVRNRRRAERKAVERKSKKRGGRGRGDGDGADFVPEAVSAGAI